MSAVSVGDRVRVTYANTAALSRGEVVRVTWVCPLGSGHINVVRRFDVPHLIADGAHTGGLDIQFADQG